MDLIRSYVIFVALRASVLVVRQLFRTSIIQRTNLSVGLITSIVQQHALVRIDLIDLFGD